MSITRTATRTATSTTVAAAAMVAVSAVALGVVWGILAASTFIVAQPRAQVVHMAVAPPGAAPVLGDQRVVAIVLQPTGFPSPQITASEVVQRVFTEVNHFYRQNSYGQMQLVGLDGTAGGPKDVYPPFGAYPVTLPYYCLRGGVRSPVACAPDSADPNFCAGDHTCVVSCNKDDLLTAALAAAGNRIPLVNGATVMMVLPERMNCNNGEGTIGQEPYTLSNGTVIALGKVSVSKATASVMAHELGHTFHFWHADSRDCADATTLIENCPSLNMGDPYDIMGAGTLADGLLHSNAFAKEHWGWLQLSADPALKHRIQEVTPQNQLQTFYLSPLEDQAGGLQALKIRHGPADTAPYLYVEYRQPLDLDAKILALPDYDPAYTNVFGGVLLHVGEPKKITANIFGPKPFQTGKFSALPFGQSYTDSSTGSTITVGQPDPVTGLPVTVTLGRTDFDPPTNLQLRELGRPDHCTIQYEASAEDASGISKIEFYTQHPTTAANNKVAEYVGSPAAYAVDLRTQKADYFWFRAYDQAGTLGYGQSNWTESQRVRLYDAEDKPCDITSPEVTFELPDLPYSFSTLTKEPNGAGQGWREYTIPSITARSPVTFRLNVVDDNGLYFVGLDEDFNKAPTHCGEKSCLYMFSDLSMKNNVKSYSAQEVFPFTPDTYYFYIRARDDFLNSTKINFTLNVLPPLPFHRGDANASGSADVTDAVNILGYLFLGNPAGLPCAKAADVNDDGEVTIVDAQYLLQYLYVGDLPNPPTPFTSCGTDPTPDLLRCDRSPACPSP